MWYKLRILETKGNSGPNTRLAKCFFKASAKRVLGPEFPLVSRIRNLYHKNILLKIERDASVGQVKKILTELLIKFKSTSDYKSVRVNIDVDPM